jgi:hypothetical protein
MSRSYISSPPSAFVECSGTALACCYFYTQSPFLTPRTTRKPRSYSSPALSVLPRPLTHSVEELTDVIATINVIRHNTWLTGGLFRQSGLLLVTLKSCDRTESFWSLLPLSWNIETRKFISVLTRGHGWTLFRATWTQCTSSVLTAFKVHRRHCRAVNTPISYSGGPVFKWRFRDRLFWLRSSVVFLHPSRQMLRQYLEFRPRALPSTSF